LALADQVAAQRHKEKAQYLPDVTEQWQLSCTSLSLSPIMIHLTKCNSTTQAQAL
jgi:hypothetical protein